MPNPHEETATAGGKKGYSSPTGTTTGRPNPHTDTGFSRATKTTKTHTTANGGDGNKTSKPERYKSKIKVVGPTTAIAWAADTLLSPITSKYNEKKRTDFARKEGLYREHYIANQYNKDPNQELLMS